MELTPGQAVGPYRLVEPAGAGGMAEVWRAYHPRLDAYVAIKFLSPRYATDPTYLERFQREARAISRLDHPNILTVHDFGEQDGWTYMVSPFIGGGTLAARLNRGPWSIAEAVAVLEPLASALDYAHRMGLVHRDVKPGNVLFTEGGRLVLSDFGIARMLEATSVMTGAGLIVGTPMYMSPEQADGEPAGPASDLYSLGVVAYQMLTGRPPFLGETPLALLRAHIDKPLPPPRKVNDALPEAVEAALFKVMAKKPDDRYRSGTEFVAALRAASAAPGPVAPTAVLPEPPSPTASRVVGLDEVRPASLGGNPAGGPAQAPTTALPPPTSAMPAPPLSGAAPAGRGSSVDGPGRSGRLSRRRMLLSLGAVAVAGTGIGALALGVPGLVIGGMVRATPTPTRTLGSLAGPLPQVRLGVLVPKTGPGARTGAEALEALERLTAFSKVVYIPKWEYFTTVEDDADDPARAADAARRLIDQGKVAVAVSLSGPAAAEAAAPVFQRAGVPLLTAFARSPALSSAGDFVFAAFEEHARLPFGDAASYAMHRVNGAVADAAMAKGDEKLVDSKAIRDLFAQQQPYLHPSDRSPPE